MRSVKKILVVTCVFILIISLFNIIAVNIISEKNKERNICINRIDNGISKFISENGICADDKERIVQVTNTVFSEYHDHGTNTGCPDRVVFVSANEKSSFSSLGEENTVFCAVRDCDGELAGFAGFIYYDRTDRKIFILFNVMFSAFFVLFLAGIIYTDIKILRPFNEISAFPERISRGLTNARLPESKNRFFGKYIWGMNMLCDKMENDRKIINRLEHDRQTLLASIAHGVKTPVTNILLYSEAISTGLYSEGKTHPEDSAIARKISENALTIQDLTSELLKTASETVVYETREVSDFYLKELADMIRSEYTKKMQIKKIPFSVICEENPIMTGDINTLMMIAVQITENAIKYGDGKGITICLEKQDDGSICISFRNRGQLLSEKEMPFVFNSFWRGSNSEKTEGNGIGLYVSKKLAAGMGGNIYVSRHEDTEEMEFLLVIR